MDIEELEQKLTKEREKYLMLTQSDNGGISRLPYLVINDQVIDLFD